MRLDTIFSYFLFSYLFFHRLFYGPIHPVSQKPKGTSINVEVRANWSWSASYSTFIQLVGPGVVGYVAIANGPLCRTHILVIYMESESPEP